jgi:hypothetical protein
MEERGDKTNTLFLIKTSRRRGNRGRKTLEDSRWGNADLTSWIPYTGHCPSSPRAPAQPWAAAVSRAPPSLSWRRSARAPCWSCPKEAASVARRLRPVAARQGSDKRRGCALLWKGGGRWHGPRCAGVQADWGGRRHANINIQRSAQVTREHSRLDLLSPGSWIHSSFDL